jgi:hypothetical protein
VRWDFHVVGLEGWNIFLAVLQKELFVPLAQKGKLYRLAAL